VAPGARPLASPNSTVGRGICRGRAVEGRPAPPPIRNKVEVGQIDGLGTVVDPQVTIARARTSRPSAKGAATAP
jgi:hypothetical protein